MVEKDGILVPTPKPTPGVWNQMSRFRKSLRPHLTPTTRLTTEEFLGFYSGRKLERYKEAAESLAVRPLEDKDAWLSTFVKAEKLCLSKKPDPAPRVIQPRSTRFNVELGRYLRHAEKYLFKALDSLFGGRTVFKGINADEQGIEMKNIWDQFRDPVAIGMDASRFDQHVSKEALLFEHKVWCDMFPHAQRKQLRTLLNQQLVNRGLARCPDGEIRYTVEGCRMSGDMNTSSGNCLIMCSSVYEWCRKQGIAKFRLANNGDDCVVFMERSDEKRFLRGCKEYYTSLGFTMKIEEPVYTLEHVEFCQARPVLVSGEYRMVRNLHQSISKDLHCLHDIAVSKHAEAWISAVGMGGQSSCSGVPVLQTFYHQFPHSEHKLSGQLREKFLESQGFKYNLNRSCEMTQVEADSRYSFWLAFGLTPDEQIALENGFKPISFQRTSNEEVGEEVSLLSFSRA
jgi:hypothetical protein